MILTLITALLTGCNTSRSTDEIDITKLPSRFDLRNADGKNYVTPVKTQRYGDCWTFALMGSAEIAYLYANDMGVPAGEKNDKVDFSEKYIAWYMFHGITKDDVVRGKVRSSQVGEGFDPTAMEKEKGELSAYFIGGPFVQTANLFGSGFGPVDESVKVKDELPYAYNDEASVEWTLPNNAEYRNAPVSALFRDSRVLPSPSSTDADGSYRLNKEGIDAIKSELYQGHGVCVSLNAQHPGLNSKNRAVYYDGDEKPNHAVAVVGYDDDFPKEKFARTKSDGTVIEGSTPPDNGALIVKNSWGLTTFDGDTDDGFLYLSYYDHSLLSALSYVFDNNDKAKHIARNIDQYDLMMTIWYGASDYETETRMARVTGIINPGESFLYTDGKWSDMSERKESLMDTAYQQCAQVVASDKAIPQFELNKRDFTVDNYPIKAILSPKEK